MTEIVLSAARSFFYAKRKPLRRAVGLVGVTSDITDTFAIFVKDLESEERALTECVVDISESVRNRAMFAHRRGALCRAVDREHSDAISRGETFDIEFHFPEEDHQEDTTKHEREECFRRHHDPEAGEPGRGEGDNNEETGDSQNDQFREVVSHDQPDVVFAKDTHSNSFVDKKKNITFVQHFHSFVNVLLVIDRLFDILLQ